MSNYGNLQLRGGLRVSVQGFTNAANPQKVTIKPPTGPDAIFNGSGEGNVAMKLTQPGFLATGAGWPHFVVPGTPNQLANYKVTCTNSGNNPSKIEIDESICQNPAGGFMFLGSVSSEDAGDNDYNDSLTLFTAFATPQA